MNHKIERLRIKFPHLTRRKVFSFKAFQPKIFLVAEFLTMIVQIHFIYAGDIFILSRFLLFQLFRLQQCKKTFSSSLNFIESCTQNYFSRESRAKKKIDCKRFAFLSWAEENYFWSAKGKTDAVNWMPKRILFIFNKEKGQMNDRDEKLM